MPDRNRPIWIKAIQTYFPWVLLYQYSPIENLAGTLCFREAKDAGIPVILIDRKVSVDDDSLYASLGWFRFCLRRTGCRLLAWGLHEKAGQEDDEVNIVVLKGTKRQLSATIGRTSSMKWQKVQRNWNIFATGRRRITSKEKEVWQGFWIQWGHRCGGFWNDDMTWCSWSHQRSRNCRRWTAILHGNFLWHSGCGCVEAVKAWGEINIDVSVILTKGKIRGQDHSGYGRWQRNKHIMFRWVYTGERWGGRKCYGRYFWLKDETVIYRAQGQDSRDQFRTVFVELADGEMALPLIRKAKRMYWSRILKCLLWMGFP